MAVALLAAAGCAHAGTEPLYFGKSDWMRALEHHGVDPSFAVFPFETTPEMEAWVDDVLIGFSHTAVRQRLEVLQNAMFKSEFYFGYEEDLTLTAAEAFEQGRGNCMSFTALFVAMSRSAGIHTFLMSVRRAPEVDRRDDLVVVNHHVVAGHRGPQEVSVYDFYVTSAAPFIQQFVIDDVMATAMYHNNLGGAAIRDGDLELAFRHLAVTTALAPEWAPGWVNLGVARFRSGDTNRALASYQRALEVEPNNSSALTNMAYVYRYLGHQGEAETALRAAAQRTTNPFTLIAIADSEMLRGNYDHAESYLRKAKRWYRQEPEVYDALARLARYREDERRAEKHLARAAELRRRKAEAES